MKVGARLLLVLAATTLLCATARGDEDGAKKKAFLKGIGKAFEAGDASAVSDHFPAKKKVELRLRGVKNGEYRKKQATSLLADYLKGMEPIDCKLEEIRGGVGRFKTKYKVRADGKVIEGSLSVYIRKEGDGWRITAIVES